MVDLALFLTQTAVALAGARLLASHIIEERTAEYRQIALREFQYAAKTHDENQTLREKLQRADRGEQNVHPRLMDPVELTQLPA